MEMTQGTVNAILAMMSNSAMTGGGQRYSMLTIDVPLFNPKTVRSREVWGMLLGVAIVVLYLDYHFQQRGCSNTPHFISGCKEYELSRFRHGIVQLLTGSNA